MPQLRWRHNNVFALPSRRDALPRIVSRRIATRRHAPHRNATQRFSLVQCFPAAAARIAAPRRASRRPAAPRNATFLFFSFPARRYGSHRLAPPRHAPPRISALRVAPLRSATQRPRHAVHCSASRRSATQRKGSNSCSTPVLKTKRTSLVLLSGCVLSRLAGQQRMLSFQPRLVATFKLAGICSCARSSTSMRSPASCSKSVRSLGYKRLPIDAVHTVGHRARRAIRRKAGTACKRMASALNKTNDAPPWTVLQVNREISVLGLVRAMARDPIAGKAAEDATETAPAPIAMVAARLVKALA